MKTASKAGVFLIAVILLNAALAAGNLIAYRTISKKEAQLIDLQRKVFIVEGKKQNLNFAKNLLKDVQEDKKRIEKVFLNSEQIIEFIEKLEDLASTSKVKIEFQAAEVPAKSDIEKTPAFVFNATGLFGDIMRFLVLLENLPYQIDVQEAVFNALSEEKSFEAGFKIKILSYSAD